MASSSGEKDFEKVLNNLSVGFWQLPVLVVGCLVWGVLAPHTIGAALFNAPVPFHCNSPFLAGSRNSSGDYYDSICLTDQRINYKDKIPERNSECPNVQYDTSVYESTVTTEWHLICEWSLLRPLFQNIYTVGACVGCLVGGSAGDRFGRKKTLLMAAAVHIVSSLVIVVTSDFVVLLLARALVGFACLVSLVSVMTLVTETFPMKRRAMVGMGLGLPHSIGIIIFAGSGYLIRRWRHLYMATTFPGFLTFPIAFLIPESPRWLLQRGYVDETKAIIKKAARMNRVQLPPERDLDELLSSIAQRREIPAFDSPVTSGSYSTASSPTSKTDSSVSARTFDLLKRASYLEVIKAFLRTPAMRRITIIIPSIACLHNILYYGIIFNANNFTSTNPFVYVALTGVADGLAVFLGTAVSDRFGRRSVVGGGLVLSGALYLTLLVVPDSVRWLQWILVMTAFLMVGAASQMLYVYVPELFPTSLRARGFSFSTLMSYFGAFLAPFVPDVLAQVAWWVTGVSFGVCGILSGILVPLLPETINRPLCETVNDVEERSLRRKTPYIVDPKEMEEAVKSPREINKGDGEMGNKEERVMKEEFSLGQVKRRGITGVSGSDGKTSKSDETSNQEKGTSTDGRLDENEVKMNAFDDDKTKPEN